eukprot:jgi/Psemu1/196263/e_gw1.184.66.1
MHADSTQVQDDASVADTISQFAKAAFTSQGLEAAGRYTREKAMELKTQAQEGDRSLRFLALIGGVACLVIGSFELTSRILHLQLVAAIIDVYIIMLGLVVVILEGKDLFLSKKLVQNINKYALFLKFLWGRGSLYFICGTLQLSQIDLFNFIAGGYMCAVGILYIVVGKSTASKLKAIRKALYSEGTLRTKFQEANVTGGGLDLKQFRFLCQNLGLDLTAREIEAAFDFIRKSEDDTNEKLSYENFKEWWNDLEGDGQIDENAFIFV